MMVQFNCYLIVYDMCGNVLLEMMMLCCYESNGYFYVNYVGMLNIYVGIGVLVSSVVSNYCYKNGINYENMFDMQIIYIWIWWDSVQQVSVVFKFNIGQLIIYNMFYYYDVNGYLILVYVVDGWLCLIIYINDVGGQVLV